MGARGPKPLPANVHRLRGNASKLPGSAFTGAVEPEVEIPNCPKHLLPEAKKFWRGITPELQVLGLIGKIDRAALALAAQEWAWWVWHDTKLQADIKRVEAAEAAALAEHEQKVRDYEAAIAAGGDAATQARKPDPFVWTGGDGFTVPTPNGHAGYNLHWVGRNKAAAALDKFLQSFGMSPSARGRVTPSSRQMALPGVEPSAGFNSM